MELQLFITIFCVEWPHHWIGHEKLPQIDHSYVKIDWIPVWSADMYSYKYNMTSPLKGLEKLSNIDLSHVKFHSLGMSSLREKTTKPYQTKPIMMQTFIWIHNQILFNFPSWQIFNLGSKMHICTSQSEQSTIKCTFEDLRRPNQWLPWHPQNPEDAFYDIFKGHLYWSLDKTVTATFIKTFWKL